MQEQKEKFPLRLYLCMLLLWSTFVVLLFAAAPVLGALIFGR